MTSLLDPLPDEGQQLVDLVAHAYAMTGTWPVWQFVAQPAFGKYGMDAEAALHSLPQWQGPGVTSYQAVRTVPAAAGNSSPDIEARTVLTVHGFSTRAAMRNIRWSAHSGKRSKSGQNSKGAPPSAR